MPQSPLIYRFFFSCIVRRCNSGLWAKLVRRGGGMRKGRAEKLFNMFVCFFNPPYATRTLMPHLVLEIKSASCYLFVFHPTPNSRSQRKTHFIFKHRFCFPHHASTSECHPFKHMSPSFSLHFLSFITSLKSKEVS